MRDKAVSLEPEGVQHGLLPEAPSAEEGRQGVHDAKREDALDGPGYDAQCQDVRVILVPGLNIERQKCYGWVRLSWLACVRVSRSGDGRTGEECRDRLPALPEVHARGEDDDLERGVARVHTCWVLSQSILSSPVARQSRLY